MKVTDCYNIVLVEKDPQTHRLEPVCVLGLRYVDEARKVISRCSTALGAPAAARYSCSEVPPPPNATTAELSEWADRFLNVHPGKMVTPTQDRETRKIEEIAKKLLDELDRMMAMASLLVAHQHDYLKSGDWMEKRYLTYLEVGKRHPKWDESTCRRTIQEMRIKFGKRVVNAVDLMCSNRLPEICKAIWPIIKDHPKVGAPKLQAVLASQGIEESQRNVGKALAILKDCMCRDSIRAPADRLFDWK